MGYIPENNVDLSTIKAGDSIEGIYYCKQAAVKSTKNSTYYIDMIISDNTLSQGLPIKQWDVAADIVAPTSGSLVYVRFIVEKYEANLQGRVSKVIEVTKENCSQSKLDILIPKLIPTAEEDFELCKQKFENYINSLSDEYKSVVNDVLDTVGRDKFYKIASGRRMHGACVHGNLVHTLHVIQNCIGLAAQYKNIDTNLLIAGAAIHDCGKAYDEFIVNDFGLVSDYSVSANLCGGHIISGSTLVYNTAKKHNLSEEKCMLLRHMVLSHHGEFGPVMPGISEAYILSMADRIDATVEQIQEAADTVEPGKTTDNIARIGNARIYNKTNA